ncbi:MAG: efflux transporter outer membrane subunit [Deltaproteobacteria bacterium]|nr:efflux transporter outer membrane subunit [Deltaproteobacteria bacterium]
MFLLGLALASCAGLKPDISASLPKDFPSVFSLYSEADSHAEAWWKSLQSHELDLLMEKSLPENFTVLQARARLEQARCTALKAGAYDYPEVTFSVSAVRQELHEKGEAQVSAEQWSSGFDAAYEVDLWGRVQALKGSEAEKYAASKEDVKAALMSLSEAVAQSWIELIDNRAHQDLLLKQLALQEKLLKLIIVRFPLARATALDIYQQQQIVEKLRAALIPMVRNQEIIKRRLALLAGRSSLADEMLEARSFPELTSQPVLGLPADLIAARPDVQAAGRRLHAGEWEVAAARADRLPALRLTASAKLSADSLSSIFDNWILNLAANLAGPVFDGGRRRAEVARVRAVVAERLALYRETVLTALAEVEDALTREAEAAATLDSLEKQLELSRQTLREARRRYLNGSSDFINVLNEELNTLQFEHDIISQEKQLRLARISLHVALGGSWVDELNNAGSALKEGTAHGEN